MRVLAPQDYRAMPWKNGGGTTWEVAVHPSGADWEHFDWRISIAEVVRDGPFSQFPGIDRVLVVVSGNGMRLAGLGDTPLDLVPGDRVAFDGESRIDGVLLDGPTRDFNLMTRRGRARADVEVVRNARELRHGGATCVCHVVSGTCTCVIDAATIDVREAHTLIADGAHFAVDATRGAVAIMARVMP